MTYSLNEIESLGKRAARGAGLDWGLAEEAGKALRWLVERDLPGPVLLAEVLRLHDGRPAGALAPAAENSPWRAPGGRLSPLLAGPALADRAAALAAGVGVELGETAWPLLLAPHLAAAAKITGQAMTLAWAGIEITLAAPGPNGCDFALAGDRAALACPAAPTLRITAQPTSATCTGSANRRWRADPDAAVLASLDAFACRTYAPASESSRLMGAGAGLSDND